MNKINFVVKILKVDVRIMQFLVVGASHVGHKVLPILEAIGELRHRPSGQTHLLQGKCCLSQNPQCIDCPPTFEGDVQ